MTPSKKANEKIELIKSLYEEESIHQLVKMTTTLSDFVQRITLPDEELQSMMSEDQSQISFTSPTRKRGMTMSVSTNFLNIMDQTESQVQILTSENKELQEENLRIQQMSESKNNRIDELQRALNKSEAIIETQKISLIDLRGRANIGLLGVLELDLAKEKEINQELGIRVQDKANEYRQKLQQYQRRFEEQKDKINELENVKEEYKKIKDKVPMNLKSDEQIKLITQNSMEIEVINNPSLPLDRLETRNRGTKGFNPGSKNR